MKYLSKRSVFALFVCVCTLLSCVTVPVFTSATESENTLEDIDASNVANNVELQSTTAAGISLNLSVIEVPLGESRTLTATTNPSGGTVEWQSSDSSIATVSNGVVTGKTTGTTTIMAGYMDADRNMHVAECTVNVRIEQGEYFLQNKQTGYYADIKGPTMASGTTIHQWRFNLNNSQKWDFTHLGDGYYSIKSKNSSTAYYLGVINDSSALDVDIVLRAGSLTNGMKWKIAVTDNGAFKLIPKTGESKGYVLATTTSSATNGAKLIQGAYVDNDSYRDEWNIHLVSEYVYRTESANIYYDDVTDASAYWSDYWIEYHYNTAVAAITNKFYVDFEVKNIGYSSSLNLSASCSTGQFVACNQSCAPLSSCNTKHHKGGYRLTNLLTSSTSYTCRLVSYTLCCYNEGAHIDADGSGNVSGKNSIVTTDSTRSLQTLIQHELSHNLGADHDTCDENQDCVLKGNEGFWCSACETAIKNTIKNST